MTPARVPPKIKIWDLLEKLLQLTEQFQSSPNCCWSSSENAEKADQVLTRVMRKQGRKAIELNCIAYIKQLNIVKSHIFSICLVDILKSDNLFNLKMIPQTLPEEEGLRQSIRDSLRQSAVGQTLSRWGSIDDMACLMVFMHNIIWVLAFIYPNEHDFSPFETGMVRGFTVTIVNMAVCLFKGFDLDFRPSKVSLGSLNKRNGTMCVHGIMTALAQFYLPLPVVHIIQASGALFVNLADYLQNGVRLNNEQLKGMAVGFIGILLVINDDILLSLLGFSTSSQSEFKNYHSHNIWVSSGIAIGMLVVMFFWGFAVVETKKMHNTNTFQINFHLGVLLVLSSGLLLPSTGGSASLQQILMAIVLQGIPMTIAQLFFIGAFVMSDQHGKLSMVNFSVVIIAYLISVFRYHQPLNLVAILGTVLAISGVIKCIFNKS